MPVAHSGPFTIANLISWAELGDFAAQAKDPKWPHMEHGILLDFKSTMPGENDALPNGFQFPSPAMSDFQRAVYYAAVARYKGPNPTFSPAFDRVRDYVWAHYGEDLTTKTACRLRGDLIRRHNLTLEAAGAMSLEAAMDRLDAHTREERREVGKPKPDDKPDGPFDADGFRFAGVEVRFWRANKQYRLVMALWDAKKNRPAEPRPIEDVITDVWGNENETEDSTFRQLCADTRRRFQTANCPLNIQQTNGKVQLSPQ